MKKLALRVTPSFTRRCERIDDSYRSPKATAVPTRRSSRSRGRGSAAVPRQRDVEVELRESADRAVAPGPCRGWSVDIGRCSPPTFISESPANSVRCSLRVERDVSGRVARCVDHLQPAGERQHLAVVEDAIDLQRERSRRELVEQRTDRPSCSAATERGLRRTAHRPRGRRAARRVRSTSAPALPVWSKW